ncbi:molybdopterin molybdotransferase MoeA [Streptomyces sp. HB2AG]|uniref:molybdopterin molybdotransferase MoeA n=1 Tax=Streptomyces sp. HB2AG TaxID=2983400 RepID=UPI0022AA8DAD|nr:molybdopterin molybdotransferase MoeA [Streptomyces sp. HB2AG]MCZ2524715.1 molybdopterin molybdotransferase MoeA [Streptomyces sp. HB2AG]
MNPGPRPASGSAPRRGPAAGGAPPGPHAGVRGGNAEPGGAEEDDLLALARISARRSGAPDGRGGSPDRAGAGTAGEPAACGDPRDDGRAHHGGTHHGTHHRSAHHHGTHGSAAHDADWDGARRTAARAARPLPAVTVPSAEALGCTLATSLEALTDLPSFDSSAMDGWAVAGPGPWRLTGQVLAGESADGPLEDGTAVRIATGAALPPGATGVLRREHGRVTGPEPSHRQPSEPGVPHTQPHTQPHAQPGPQVLHALRGAPAPGQDVRPRGQECRSGDELLPSGVLVTPAVLGLAAAAGYDELAVVPRPAVELLVLGDELLDSGLPRDGRVRDALGPLLAPWLEDLGAEVVASRRVEDDAEALHRAVAGSSADVVVTTGGTAGGPVDFVHPVLERLGARLLVDGVAVRPGHPMLLAALPGGRHLVGLPGNPLAAVSGVLTLAVPLLDALAGRPLRPRRRVPLAAAVPGHPTSTRLVPVVLRGTHGGAGGEAVPLRFNGPAMLRGVAAADGLAVVPPGGAAAGTETEILESVC